MTEFTDLPLRPALYEGLDALGHTAMTPVQARSLPTLLEGRDVVVQAPTGSGKTLAFALALLQPIELADARVQALVLCPTRELAEQVARQIRKAATGLANLKLLVLTGGIPLAPQVASLQHAPHVVVGTPGRIQELVESGALDLRATRVLVLDEADRMLDMGFEESIRAIVKRLPTARQTLLFSATLPDGVRGIATRLLRDPAEVTVDAGAADGAIEQAFFEVAASRKPAALAGLLLEHPAESTVVFCNMRRDADDVAASLAHLGFAALALHGDLEQRDRDEVLVRFANRSCTVLVASDVAARGLDVETVGLVVNYDVPSDPDTYVHRIGRTGRAGREGVALTLCTDAERGRAAAIETALGRPLRWREAPIATLRQGLAPTAPMATLRIDAGRTDKLRPGDIVGALTGEAGLPGDAVGKIDVFPTRSYVAVDRRHVARALERLQAGKIKGRKFRVRRI